MDKRNRCFFIGHRDAPESVYPALCRAVENHIAEHGVTEFVVGRYGNFDSMAARAVTEAKIRHPDVTLTVLLPYHPSGAKEKVPAGFDASWYPPGMETVPARAAIVRAVWYAVDHSAYVIACVRHPASNAQKFTEYARKKTAVTLL